ncbi:hypothetical protein N1851_011126 [Merluccius polli]|uniref:Uncharacterized protein n=1 Tax=Merluccius polli TaxID=89951 RepID=A0AA47MXK7_MERPO|nr:hypothetical protein N1851_011126 [Merluccius polli]
MGQYDVHVHQPYSCNTTAHYGQPTHSRTPNEAKRYFFIITKNDDGSVNIISKLFGCCAECRDGGGGGLFQPAVGSSSELPHTLLLLLYLLLLLLLSLTVHRAPPALSCRSGVWYSPDVQRRCALFPASSSSSSSSSSFPASCSSSSPPAGCRSRWVTYSPGPSPTSRGRGLSKASLAKASLP